jgi:AhpD family alkylhydroperoxidase
MRRIMFSTCRICQRGFYYERVGLHSRLRQYCDDCIVAHRRAASRERVRRCRAKKKQIADDTQKQPSGDRPGSSVWDTREASERATPSTGRGLFAQLPDPGRTQKRKAFGLS